MTIDVDRGAEIELNKDISSSLHGSLLHFEFSMQDEIVPRVFWIPNHFDELLAFLFDLSLTKTIDHAFRHLDVCKGRRYLTGYGFTLVDSPNGQTNITPEFLDSVARWKEVLDDRR